jgi:hypothetical protein
MAVKVRIDSTLPCVTLRHTYLKPKPNKRRWFLALCRRPKRWHLHPPQHRQRRHNYERVIVK